MIVVLASIQTDPLLLQQSWASSQPVDQLLALAVAVVEPSARQPMPVVDCSKPSAGQPIPSAMCAERFDWMVADTEQSRCWCLVTVIPGRLSVAPWDVDMARLCGAQNQLLGHGTPN